MCVCNVPLGHWYVFAERSTGFGAGAGAGTGIFCKVMVAERVGVGGLV